MVEKKVQSPSSIKTYKHCPRKYYYTYILKLPTPPNIHLVRGNIAHSVLENFFDIDTSVISIDDYQTHLKLVMQRLLLKEWQNYKKKLDALELTKEDEMHYFEDTLMMLLKWAELFFTKIEKRKGTFQERFKELTPQRELLYVSEKYHTKGYIDAVEKHEGITRLMDYKTSKKHDINDHILQLAIYSLLYYDKHGYMPEQVGIYFLKGGEAIQDVDEELLALAKKEIAHVHENTTSEDINQYGKNPGPLCKYRTGQCEFYDTCRPFD